MKTALPKLAMFVVLLSTACTNNQKPSLYDELKSYEGLFEYSNPKTLVLMPSTYDTLLYAIVDDAPYPLTYIHRDTFETRQKQPVIFQRDAQGQVVSYTTEGRTFKLINRSVEPRDWFPRKELYEHADAYQYQVPLEKGDGIAVGDINDVFAHPDSLIKMVKETIKGEYRDVHSILIWKDGKLVLEEYFYGDHMDKPHQLRSASKSFISTLVGIAIDQGKLKSENELLMPLFAKEYPSIENMDARKKKITVKDFLTYRHGMDCNDEDPSTAGNELKLIQAPDWAKFTLDLPMKEEPGKRSSYCSGCPQTLARMVEIVVDEPLVEYADKNLFGPMGITNYKWRFKADSSSAGTFNQMYLRPRDMLKLGIMYKDQGVWQGKQIVSADWIKRTFAKDDVEFGYLWRHKDFEANGKRYESYMATGNGGQKVNIWPELNMITVFTGGNYNSFALYGRNTPPNEMIPKHILTALP